MSLSQNPSLPRGLPRRVVLNGLIVVVGLLVPLLVLELGIRLFEGVPSESFQSDRPQYYYTHPDAASMKDHPYPTTKPDGEFRIAILGDSFTFGTALQVDDTFPKQLQSLYHNAGHKHVRVINYGVPGYSTVNELVSAQQAYAEGADLVVLQITLNDPQKKLFLPTGLQKSKNRFGEYRLEGSTAALAEWWHSAGFLLKRIHNSRTQKNYIRFYFDLFENEITWNYFRIAINRHARLGKAEQKPFLALVFPLFGLPLDAQYPFVPIHEKIATLLKKKKIKSLDLLESYRNIPLRRIQVEPGVDFHPNEIGHRIAADALYQWFEKLDISLESIEAKTLSAEERLLRRRARKMASAPPGLRSKRRGNKP